MSNLPLVDIKNTLQVEVANWYEHLKEKSITKKEYIDWVLLAVWHATDIILWWNINANPVFKWHFIWQWYNWQVINGWIEIIKEINESLDDLSNWLINQKEVKNRVLDVLNQVI